MPDDEVAGLRAVAHPVRLRILSLLTGTQMSAAEVARELGLTHANASYHLRVLAEAGELVDAGEERIRGGVAKRYRHPWDRTRRGQRRRSVGAGAWQMHVRAMSEELVRRARRRAPRSRSLLTDAELWVSPEAWRQAKALVEEASRLLHQDARPPHTSGLVHANLTAAMFEMTEQ